MFSTSKHSNWSDALKKSLTQNYQNLLTNPYQAFWKTDYSFLDLEKVPKYRYVLNFLHLSWVLALLKWTLFGQMLAIEFLHLFVCFYFWAPQIVSVWANCFDLWWKSPKMHLRVYSMPYLTPFLCLKPTQALLSSIQHTFCSYQGVVLQYFVCHLFWAVAKFMWIEAQSTRFISRGGR